jgi:hypothetical protein
MTMRPYAVAAALSRPDGSLPDTEWEFQEARAASREQSPIAALLGKTLPGCSSQAWR